MNVLEGIFWWGIARMKNSPNCRLDIVRLNGYDICSIVEEVCDV